MTSEHRSSPESIDHSFCRPSSYSAPPHHTTPDTLLHQHLHTPPAFQYHLHRVSVPTLLGVCPSAPTTLPHASTYYRRKKQGQDDKPWTRLSTCGYSVECQSSACPHALGSTNPTAQPDFLRWDAPAHFFLLFQSG